MSHLRSRSPQQTLFGFTRRAPVEILISTCTLQGIINILVRGSGAVSENLETGDPKCFGENAKSLHTHNT